MFGNGLDYFFLYLFVDKSKRKHKMKEDSSNIAAKMKNVQFSSSQDTPMEEHENVLQGQQKNGTENEREKVPLVAESPIERKSVILPEHSDLRKASGMTDWQKAGTSKDGCSNGKQKVKQVIYLLFLLEEG